MLLIFGKSLFRDFFCLYFVDKKVTKLIQIHFLTTLIGKVFFWINNW